jgi:peptide chain release factor subunit 1
MAADAITRGRVRRIASVRPERGRVLSAFLNLDPSELPTPPARASAITSVMTEAAHKVDAAEDLSHDEKVALREDVERVRELLRSPGIAADGVRGLAVYASKPAGLLEVVRLSHPIEARVCIDRTAYVEPLVAAGKDGRWGVLLITRRAARLFFGSADGLQETDRIEDDVHRQHDQGGWSQKRYQRSVEKEKDDHVARTVDVLFAAFKAQPFDHLLIAAPSELVATYEQRLHPYLRERCAGRLQLDVEHAGIEEVRRRATEAAEEWTRRVEREALDRLEEAVGRGDRGRARLEPVLDALNQARVELLLVQPGLRASGYRDPDSDLLFADQGIGPTGRPLEPVEDVVEAALAKAIEQAAEIRAVRHHDDLGPLGGIGAVLRF